MIDDKEIPNEEDRTTPDQTAIAGEETEVAEEAAQEPVRQDAESVNEAEAALDLAELPAGDAPAKEAIAQSSEEEQMPTPNVSEAPAATEEPAAEDESAPQAEGPQTGNSEPESAPEVDEALVEMLETAQTPDSEQTVENVEVSGAPSSVISPPDTEQSPTIESVIEAVLFATDEPLPESKLAGMVETTAKQVRESVESLNAKYQANNNAFRIEQIAGGYQMLTQPIYNPWLKKMLRVRSDNKLSPAAMETLAIIAYKQPIIRADIEAIRGVAVGEVIRSLMYKGLVKIAGRAEILGRPMLYGTTKKFLEVFGLNSLKDLPKAEDLKNPDRG